MVRNVSIQILLAAAVLAVAGSCGGSGKEPAGSQTPLTVSPTSATVAALGEQKTFSVTSSTDWYARSSQSWLKVVTATGKGSGSAASLTVSAEENKTVSARTAELTVSNLGDEKVTVTIEQAAGSGEAGARGITSAADLVAFAKAVNGEGSIALYLVDGVVKIMNDIDASSITEWIPAGTSASPLTYSIDGGNHTIRNVNWKVDVSKYPLAGLVGAARNITIERLTFGSEGSRVEFSGEASGKVRAGGIVGRAEGVTLERVTNNATLAVTGKSATGNDLIIGGLAGYADADCVVGGDLRTTKGCVNNGNLLVTVAAQEGGLVGYLSGKVTNCTNYGAVLGKVDGSYGPGWLCSYNRTKANVTSNYGYGYVGDYDLHAARPEGAVPAMMKNAMMNYEEAYDLENNTVDWTLDAYYDWTEEETRTLHSGVVYHHYSCDNVPRQIHVLEVDLKDPGIEITSAFANEVVPNPNGNNNSNNGFKIRETLSQLCTRRRSEGQKILGGVNACFFDSHNGISRGFHVEEGEPVYINNPSVVSSLPNHLWGFTVFADGTASCGQKKFTGRLRTGGKEYPFYTVNDTTLRHASPDISPVNLFTARYVRTPHAAYPNLVNELADNVLYVICEYTGAPMKVNTGYAAARVVSIQDGRSARLQTLPYITAGNRVGIALSGTYATEWAGSVKVGDTVELSCTIAIDGDASKPILTLDSTMFQLMTDGKDNSGSPGTSSTLYTKYDPLTFPVVSEDGSKVWIVEIDGRQDWFSTGVKGYEIYRIAQKLGGWNVTRFDGGGSSAMWVWDASAGRGALVSSPSDSSNGKERSCLSYLLVREK
ncbi:MAG: phosphodiester glycosidase family protein [Bacteroidales bacterium]|nr:phosphodiester glycosidase family protein [Bacteroidales bacterium]